MQQQELFIPPGVTKTMVLVKTVTKTVTNGLRIDMAIDTAGPNAS